MTRTLNQVDSKSLSELAIKGVQEKKGRDICLLDLREIENAVSDYFIICQGDSNTQVNAIADSVIHEIEKATGDKPWNSEGFTNAEWVLIDYADVVVHVFQKEARAFYNLEGLWADAEMTTIEEE